MKKVALHFALSLFICSIFIPFTPAYGLITTSERTDVSTGEDVEFNLTPLKDLYDPVGDVDDVPFIKKIFDYIRAILGFLAIIFIALMIYAGYLWLTAGGNDEQASKARRVISAAIIGIAIILFSYMITIFVFRGALNAAGY